jgi:hypothetical protein
MTPTTRTTNEWSSAHRSIRRTGGPLPKREAILGKAKAVWKSKPDEIRDLSIPAWYAGAHGIPNWLLRQKASSPKMCEKRLGLSLIVRMNYVLDYHHSRFHGMVTRQHLLFSLPRREKPFFCRSHGPIFDGSYSPIMGGVRVNTSYANSINYNWKRTLACVLREFVHLLSYCRK